MFTNLSLPAHSPSLPRRPDDPVMLWITKGEIKNVSNKAYIWSLKLESHKSCDPPSSLREQTCMICTWCQRQRHAVPSIGALITRAQSSRELARVADTDSHHVRTQKSHQRAAQLSPPLALKNLQPQEHCARGLTRLDPTGTTPVLTHPQHWSDVDPKSHSVIPRGVETQEANH